MWISELVLIVCSIGVISARNPVHSVLYLVCVFINATGLLLIIGVEFMGIIFLLVYVGAIAILFLFVVMMLNIRYVEYVETIMRNIPLGMIIGIIFMVQLITHINQMKWWYEMRGITNWYENYKEWSGIEVIGQIMYTDWGGIIIIASMILVVAMIGAILLTIEQTMTLRRQDIFKQVEKEGMGL